jgi:hypothetical protein
MLLLIPAARPHKTLPLIHSNPASEPQARTAQPGRQASLQCGQSATGCHSIKKGNAVVTDSPWGSAEYDFPFGYADIMFGHLATARP